MSFCTQYTMEVPICNSIPRNFKRFLGSYNRPEFNYSVYATYWKGKMSFLCKELDYNSFVEPLVISLSSEEEELFTKLIYEFASVFNFATAILQTNDAKIKVHLQLLEDKDSCKRYGEHVVAVLHATITCEDDYSSSVLTSYLKAIKQS